MRVITNTGQIKVTTVPNWATTADIANIATTESAGTASTVPRGDHVHAAGIEDTYTPVLAGDTTAGVNTYSTQEGRYYRIGRLVWVSVRLILTAKGTAGNAMVGNIYVSLPITSRNIANIFPGGDIGLYSNIDFSAGRSQLVARVSANSTILYLSEGGDNVANANIQPAQIADTTQIVVSVVYLAE